MSILRFVAVLAVLTVPALAPLLVAVGRRPLTLVLLLPGGGVLAAVAGVLAVATATSLTGWLAAVLVVVNVAAAAVLLRRHRTGAAWIERGADSPRVMIGAVVAVAVGLTGLSRPAVDWDARSIWLLHARLLRAGGAHYVDALHNSAYAFSHVDYPPLAAATVAAAWKVWGASSYRLAEVLLALQGACLIVAAAMVLGRHVRSRPRWLAPTLSFVFVLAALGPFAIYLTNGYADVIVASGATVAAVTLLVEPPSRPAIVVGLLGAVVAAMTKDEGVVAALLVLALWVLRLLGHRQALRRVAPAAAGAVVVMLAWPALVVARGGPRGSVLGAGTVAAARSGHLSRFTHAATNLASHLLVLPIVLVATVALVIAVRRGLADRDLLARVEWLWALVALQLLVLLGTYTFGKMPIHYWLRTSGDRVSIFPALVLDAIAVLTLADPRVAVRMRR